MTVVEIALERARANAAQAEANRAAMPIVTEFVDAMREVFGPTFRVHHYNENGRVRGEPGPRGVVPQLPLKEQPRRTRE